MSETVTSKDGTTIAYDRTGSGPAVIIVTGATAFRAFDPSLAAIAALLAPHHTVITYDRRGRGESSDTAPYATRREIEDIAALIAIVGGHASIVGFSSGAVVALEAAATGLTVDKLVLYEPPFVLPGTGFPPPPPDYVEALEAMVASGDKDGPPAYFLASVGMPPEAIEAAKQSPMWPIMQSVGPTISYDGRYMFEAYYAAGKFPTRWQSAKLPVLVVNGDASFPFMRAAADAVAAELPHAVRKTLVGQDHGPKPEEFAPLVDEFLTA